MTINRTPSALALEIEKHEKYLGLVYAGVAKLGRRALKNRENYVTELKSELMNLTAYDAPEMADSELLASLLEG
jgi:hypothetical protein